MGDNYGEKSKNNVRSVIQDIRLKIPSYHNYYPGEGVTFEIVTEEDGYRLIVLNRPTEENVQVQLSLANRKGDWLETILQEESSSVLFASISSCHTLDRIRSWFDEGVVQTKHFRVLTWWPPSEEALANWADNAAEKPARVRANVESAWSGWREVQDAKDYVEVYRYTSVPTMQAICNDRYLKVELLPFNRTGACFHECGSTDHRPALIMGVEDNGAGYRFFKNAFEDLWLAAMRDALPEDVHPRWRSKRLECLRNAGLSPLA